MLMIKTKIGPSTIPNAGLGLFADEFIPKGKVTWMFCSGFDLIVSKDDLLRFSEPARQQFLNYCYFDKKTKHFVLCGDDERFINHSDNPKEINIVQSKDDGETEGVEIASRDIKPGEELFCNYYDFDEDAERKLKGLGLDEYLKYEEEIAKLSAFSFKKRFLKRKISK